MEPPSDLQAKMLRQVALASLTDRIARKRADRIVSDQEGNKKVIKGAYEVLCFYLNF